MHRDNQPGYLDVLHAASSPSSAAAHRGLTTGGASSRREPPTQRDEAPPPSYLFTLQTVAALRQCGGNPQDCTPPSTPPKDDANEGGLFPTPPGRGPAHAGAATVSVAFPGAVRSAAQCCWRRAKCWVCDPTVFAAVVVMALVALAAAHSSTSKANLGLLPRDLGAASSDGAPSDSASATASNLSQAAAPKAATKPPLALALAEAAVGALAAGGRFAVARAAALAVPASTHTWALGDTTFRGAGNGADDVNMESSMNGSNGGDGAGFWSAFVHVPEAGARAIQAVGAAPDEPAAAAADRLDSETDDGVGDQGRTLPKRDAGDEGRDALCTSPLAKKDDAAPAAAAPTPKPPPTAAPPPAPVPASPTWRGAKDLVQTQLTQRRWRAAPLLHGSKEAEEVAAGPDAAPHPSPAPTKAGGIGRQSLARALTAATAKLSRLVGRACDGAPPRVQAACARARELSGSWNAAAALEQAQRRVKAAAYKVVLVLCFFFV